LEKIELLVRLGKYASKSEALRAIIIEYLKERKELFAYEGMLSEDKKCMHIKVRKNFRTYHPMR
jgi:Arc/MetJ-type ribon-helix-helix transcriptional regulator